jgi:hypothetical protein
MMNAEKPSLLDVVDRIYESIERPQLWPETICAIGDILGGRPHFRRLDTGGFNSTQSTSILEAGCQPTFFLSRADQKALDEYEREFGDLIIRFLKIIFLSILWSPNDVHAREAIGLIVTQRYVQASTAGSARHKLIAALWQDGHAFSRDSLRSMQLLAPHLDRAVRLQMRLG